jgi:Zn finger protein HypA/HybF involved in hydrogenase expression
MSHSNWDYTIICQDCGFEEKSRTHNVYRCRYCGSKDVDVVTDDSSFENHKLDCDEED